MIRSMTGFGQAMMETDNLRVTVEMKSVNHRFLEISVRLPREFLFLEDALKKKIGESFRRGKLDVFINVERKAQQEKKLSVDWNLADQYVELIQYLMTRHSIFITAPSPTEILSLPEVTQIVEAPKEVEEGSEILLQTVDSACQQLLHMRKSEGKALKDDLSMRLTSIIQMTGEIASRAPVVSVLYRDRLASRMRDLFQGDVEDGRLMTEAAIFADKANIDEELVRLTSHCHQFSSIMETGDAVGRKLDFLVQEMNRETNTIASKASDIEISQKVVDLKAELEKMKEQVQNIE